MPEDCDCYSTHEKISSNVDYFQKRTLKTSLKIFMHYKLKPSFLIIKDNKDTAGSGWGMPPPPSFDGSNIILIQFLFFHLIRYLKINKKFALSLKIQVRIQQDFGAHCACGLRSECGRPFNKCTCANLELCLFIEMICNDR